MKGRSDLPGCGDGRHKITWIKRWSGRNELEVSESGSDASAFNGTALCIRSSKRTDTGRTTHWHHAGLCFISQKLFLLECIVRLTGPHRSLTLLQVFTTDGKWHDGQRSSPTPDVWYVKMTLLLKRVNMLSASFLLLLLFPCLKYLWVFRVRGPQLCAAGRHWSPRRQCTC